MVSLHPYVRGGRGAAIAAMALVTGAPLMRASDWRTLKTPQFTILTDTTGAVTHRVAADAADGIAFLGKMLPLDPANCQPLTIVLFDQQDELAPFLPLLPDGRRIDQVEQELDIVTVLEAGMGPDWVIAGAACHGYGMDRPDDYETQTRPAVLTGVAHWAFSGMDFHVPLAVHQGMVLLFSHYRREISHVEIGRPLPGFRTVLTNFPLLPVQELLSVDDMKSMYRQGEIVRFDAESWGLMHFLMFSRTASERHALNAFWSALRAHQRPMQALATAMGPDNAAKIDTLLTAYLHSMFYEVKLPMGSEPENRAPLERADAATVQSTFAELALVTRPDTALTYADAAVAAADGAAWPYAIRAQVLASRPATLGGASAAINAAYQRGSRDAWVLWREGLSAIAGGTPSPAAARSAVNAAERALISDHAFVPAFDLLGRELWAADHVTPSDERFLDFGRLHHPSDRWILVGLAALQERQGNRDGARQLERQAADDPRLDPAQQSTVATFLAHVRR